MGEVTSEVTYYQGEVLVAAAVMSDQLSGGVLTCGAQTHVAVLDAALFEHDGRLVAAALPVNLDAAHASLRELRRLRGSVGMSQLASHRRYQEALAEAFRLTYARYPLILPETAFVCGPCEEEREGMFGFGVASQGAVQAQIRIEREAGALAASPAAPADLAAPVDLAGQSRRTGLPLVRLLDAQLLAFAERHARDVALFGQVREGVVAEQVEQTCFVTLRCRCGEAFCGVWTDDEVFWPDVLPGRLRFDDTRALPPLVRGLPPRRTWVNLCPACGDVVPLPPARQASWLGGRILACLLWHTDRPL